MAQFSLRMECADLGLRACVCEEAGDLPLQTGEEMGRCLHSSLYFETLFIECGSGFLTAENGSTAVSSRLALLAVAYRMQ